ncbi:hypothetical protein BDV18DRAFT_158210 [Aspergillus unguis]
MRFSLTGIVLALAAVASAEDSINCWGKATHPPENEVHNAIATMRYAIDHPVTGPNGVIKPSIRADKRSCASVWCYQKTSIRYCNDSEQPRTMGLREIADGCQAIVNKCHTVFHDIVVAGGVIDHSDHWSVVIQTDDEC